MLIFGRHWNELAYCRQISSLVPRYPLTIFWEFLVFFDILDFLRNFDTLEFLGNFGIFGNFGNFSIILECLGNLGIF